MKTSKRPARRPAVPPREAEVMIASVGARGDGVADLDGVRVYAPHTVAGDRVRLRVGEARDGEARAELIELVEPGAGRAEPACPHFGTCGGCTLQHMDAALYAGWKVGLVRTALGRAGVSDAALAPLAVTPPASRRRARFAALRRGRRVWLGFNERMSHRLVDVERCPVLAPRLAALVAPLRAVLLDVLPEGGGADALVTELDGGLDLLLVGPAALDLRAREALVGFATAHGVARMSWQPSDRAAAEPVAHIVPVAVRFGGVAVVPPPGAFLQASPQGEAALVAAVLAGVGAAAKVADLFAGLGTFSLPLAARAVVHAVEGDAPALAALAGAAHGLRLTTERRDLFAEPLTAKELARFDAVVFDPPRAGAAAQAAVLAGSTVPVVVAVSCNPATFARDARTLVDGGYALKRVHPVDQFLWSAHLELVAVFEKQ